MSGDFDEDEPAAVWHERTITARVSHTCGACLETIAPGHRYVRIVRINETGDRPEAWKRCARCEAVYRHLAKVSDEQPTTLLDCGHAYEERIGTTPPPEIAALAFALPGEVPLYCRACHGRAGGCDSCRRRRTS